MQNVNLFWTSQEALYSNHLLFCFFFICVCVCWGGVCVLLVCGAYLLLASFLFLSSYSPFLCSCLSISQDNQHFFLLKRRKHICVPV